jgi:excinuclease ABC subunit B
LDNRPLRFVEFLRKVPQLIYTSATPDIWETSQSIQVVEQLIRPTGLVDPEVEIRPTQGQVEDLIAEVTKRAKKGERSLVVTLTKRMAEALAEHLNRRGIKTHHLHADIETLDRSDILEDLRRGRYTVVVGINLLREGLDLPEVSLVAILDADKEGFLRSQTSLIQVMGRAARHAHGQAMMFADTKTAAMQQAIDEVTRRREIQLAYNRKYGIRPQTVKKPIRKKLIKREEKEKKEVLDFDPSKLTPEDRKKLRHELLKQMHKAARNLEFERAAALRDRVQALENE